MQYKIHQELNDQKLVFGNLVLAKQYNTSENGLMVHHTAYTLHTLTHRGSFMFSLKLMCLLLLCKYCMSSQINRVLLFLNF